MPSSYTARLRLEQQFTGENVNTWGIKLNTVIGRVDFSIAGMATIPLSGGAYSLTASNTADDEARAAILKFTGIGGGTVTIPAVTKKYTVWNANSGVVVITAGGATQSIDPGDVVDIFCDGVDVKPAIGYADTGGNLLTLKAYIAAQALAAGTGAPGVTGNAGKVLYTNGFTMTWQQLTTANLSDYIADQNRRFGALQGFAITAAIAF